MNKQKSSVTLMSLMLLAIIVAIGGGYYFYQRYNEINTANNQLQSENLVLANRVEVLRSSAGELEQYVNTSYQAVPETNAGLIAINSIKQMQGERQIFIGGVHVKTSLSEMGMEQPSEVGFDVSGESSEVLEFLQTLSTSLPLLKLKSMETIVAADNFATARVNMEVISKTLPQQLPSIKEPLPALTAGDRELLSQLAQYTYSPIERETSTSPDEDPDGTFGRQNPFSGIVTPGVAE